MVFKNKATSRQIANDQTPIKSVTNSLGALGRLRQLNTLFGQAIKDHARSTAGNITLFAALAAIPVFGSLGLAVDYLRVSKTAAEMQFAADSAALAAASASNVTGTPAQDAAARQTIALKYLNAEMASLDDVIIDSSPIVSVADNTVNIELNASVRGSFINALNAVKKDAAEIGTISDVGAVSTGKISTITVKSHAKWKTSGAPACITTLDPAASESFYLNSSSELNASSCDVNVLSTSNTAAKVISASSTSFRKICVKGGTSGTLAGLTANCTPGGEPCRS
jgi:Flp pilus assembly protein TadG